MHIVDGTVVSPPYFMYDAPENEKTLELRKKYDVDPKTGYPRVYNWRSHAKLGFEYKPEDPFRLFEPITDEKLISTKVTTVGATGLICAFVSLARAAYNKKPIYSYPISFLASWAASATTGLIFQKYMLKRGAYKNAMYADYMASHPERFGIIKRFKLREAIFPYRGRA